MKKMIAVLVVLGTISVFVSGCATPVPYGAIFTEVKMPVAASNEGVTGQKIGTAKCTSILGLIATGDSSIETAAKNGGISQISHVDYEVRNILGLIGEYTTKVYGR